jgi:NAD(P)-dependent dehydrogenase (short-subunit alcohol dehydrogenase family)
MAQAKIRINTIHPGLILTELTFVTGQDFIIDGGFTC